MLHTCSIIRSTLTKDRSGEETHQYDYNNPTYIAVSCLWYPVTGKRIENTLIQFSTSGVLYFEPQIDIQEEDYVTELRYPDGTAIDIGPLMVELVKRISDLDGAGHHITCRMRGVAKPITEPAGVKPSNTQRGYIA